VRVEIVRTYALEWAFQRMGGVGGNFTCDGAIVIQCEQLAVDRREGGNETSYWVCHSSWCRGPFDDTM